MIPLTHVPAAESDSTALHLARLCARGAVPWWGLGWIVLLAGVHAAFGFSETDVIGACLGIVVWTGWSIWRRRHSRWARLLEPLLQDPWRPVDVTVHGRRIAAGDAVFALPGMPRRVRDVIARTGRVWLAGGVDGHTAVRVEGSGRPWLGLVRGRVGRQTPPRPVVYPGRAKFRVVVGATWAVAVVVVALVVATIVEPPEPGEIPEAIFVYALVVVPLVWLGRWARRLRRALPTGEWRSVSGAVDDAWFTEDEPWVRGGPCCRGPVPSTSALSTARSTCTPTSGSTGASGCVVSSGSARW